MTSPQPSQPPSEPLTEPPAALLGGDSRAGRTDRLSVLGLEATGFHGVLESERRAGQIFRVDLTLGLDTARAARTDDLRDTVDYGTLSTKVRGIVEGEPVDLIETLADRIASQCLHEAMVEWVEITVHKPQAPIEATFADVALTIRRGRAEDD